MGLFAKIEIDSDVQVETEDRVGSGWQPFETDIYELDITMAYGIVSRNGAKGITLVGKIGDREYREDIYITNRNGEPFFIDKNTKKKTMLPGYKTVDDLAMIVAGKPLNELEDEEKTVKVYDRQDRKEVNTPVPALPELIGGKVLTAITATKKTVMEKDADGKYTVPTDKTRVENSIAKFMDPGSQRTVNEAIKGMEEAVFHDQWLKVNKGKERDDTAKGAPNGGQKGSGAPSTSGGAAGQKRRSLF